MNAARRPLGARDGAEPIAENATVARPVADPRELARRTREAWIACQSIGPLPEPVWQLLRLVPAVCAALERTDGPPTVERA